MCAQAVRKDIYRHQSGMRSIVNLPRNLGELTRRECEAIIRGEKDVTPPGMQGVDAVKPMAAAVADHPYLNRMHYRVGMQS